MLSRGTGTILIALAAAAALGLWALLLAPKPWRSGAVPAAPGPAEGSSSQVFSETLRSAPGALLLEKLVEIPRGNPTALAFASDGTLYVAGVNGVSDLESGWIYALRVEEPAESLRLFARDVRRPTGLLAVHGSLFVSTRGSLLVLRDRDGDGIAEERATVLSDLPYGEEPGAEGHQTHGLALGPDGRLYVGQGGTSNLGPEPAPLGGTILRVNLDGTGLEVVARGLRNPYGVAFNRRGDLFATDNGPSTDDPAMDPKDELNHVVDGGDYGYPEVYGAPPARSNVIAPVMMFPAHVGIAGIASAEGATIPGLSPDDLVVAFWNWGRLAVLGLSEDGTGYHATWERFIRGFTSPADVEVGPDGWLYVADFVDRAIYRVRPPRQGEEPTIAAGDLGLGDGDIP